MVYKWKYLKRERARGRANEREQAQESDRERERDGAVFVFLAQERDSRVKAIQREEGCREGGHTPAPRRSSKKREPA